MYVYMYVSTLFRFLLILDGRTKDGQKERKQQEKADDGDDKGDVIMIAGIVGLLLGVTVVTAIALKIFFVRRRKSQSRTEEASQSVILFFIFFLCLFKVFSHM